jgi:hypothetical protein
MKNKENLNGNRQGQTTADRVYISAMGDVVSRENPNTFQTKEKEPGMSPFQALGNHFSDRIASEGKDFIDKLGRFVKSVDDEWERKNNKGGYDKVLDKLESLAPTNEEIIVPWLSAVAGKALIDYDRKLFREGKESEIDWKDQENQKKYYGLVSDMESKWQKLAILGRNVDVNIKYPQESELVRINFVEKFGEIGDTLFDFAGETYNALTSKYAKVGGVALAAASILAACANANPPAEVSPMPTSNAETPYVKYTATAEATQAVTSVPTPTRPDLSGGPYNSEQQNLIETGAFKDTEQALTTWFKYWANATNNPFNPQTTDIHFKYVFDSTEENSGVCLESNAYPNVCFALPIVNGEVAMVPPTITSEYTIPVGYGPLELSDQLSADQISALKLDESLTNSVLGYENGGWVRIKDGQVVATLDMGTAQWKKSVDYSGVFGVDPQSENDPNVVEAPKYGDPAQDEWIKGYLDAVDAKLADYQGPFLKSDSDGTGSGKGYDIKDFVIPRNIWTPISSYKYQDNNGEWIVVKTYPVLDSKTGEKSSFSVTYSPENGLVPDGLVNRYTTPTKELTMDVWYANDFLKKKGGLTFSDNFLPVDDGQPLPIEKFLAGYGIDPNLKTEHLVFCEFLK